MRCNYFEAKKCGSCSLIEVPYDRQLADKSEHCRQLLPTVPAAGWLPAFSAGERGFRNRVKLVVGGRRGRVTLGILGPEGRGVDLRECGIQDQRITDTLPAIADFVNSTGLHPYSVPERRGELKFVHLTVAPTGEMMLRYVTRSEQGLRALRSRLTQMRQAVPQATVISVNLLPEHMAVLEGTREELLHGSTLPMRLGTAEMPLTLHLRPQSFFQTNTAVARELYAQAATWVDHIQPASVWDLYCGVGGFALHVAATGRSVYGVELSEAAVASARRSANEAALSAQFIAHDATTFALSSRGEDHPELVIVNPPRRGIGPELSAWLEGSAIRHVIYSSCNPVSLARDLAAMPAYGVRAARVFDMFPHTAHLEVAVLLERVS